MALHEVFTETHAQARAALIGYLPAGYPTMEQSLKLVCSMARSGCDIIEVGIPFSDPVMDGPLIEQASRAALTGGVRIPEVLRVIEAVAASGATPVVMSYFNPILVYGMERFAADVKNAGGCGVITPDLIADEAGEWIPAATEHSIDPIFLVAPSSTEDRLRITTQACRGFVYAASIMGVTGTREHISHSAVKLVSRLRHVTELPVCVGLGVKDRDQARWIAGYADGVIVGSAFVAAACDGSKAVSQLTEQLALGVREGHVAV